MLAEVIRPRETPCAALNGTAERFFARVCPDMPYKVFRTLKSTVCKRQTYTYERGMDPYFRYLPRRIRGELSQAELTAGGRISRIAGVVGGGIHRRSREPKKLLRGARGRKPGKAMP